MAFREKEEREREEKRKGKRERGREGEGRGGERERNINLLFQLFMYSLVVSSMCPDQGSKPQPWHIGMTLTN